MYYINESIKDNNSIISSLAVNAETFEEAKTKLKTFFNDKNIKIEPEIDNEYIFTYTSMSGDLNITGRMENFRLKVI